MHLLGPGTVENTDWKYSNQIYTDYGDLNSKCQFNSHLVFFTIVIIHLRDEALNRVKVPDPTLSNVTTRPRRQQVAHRGFDTFACECREAFPFLAALVEHMARGGFHTWIKATAVTRSEAVDGWKLMRVFKGVSGVKGTQCLSWGSQTPEMGSNALAHTRRRTACCVWALNTTWTCFDFPRVVSSNVKLLVDC